MFRSKDPEKKPLSYAEQKLRSDLEVYQLAERSNLRLANIALNQMRGALDQGQGALPMYDLSMSAFNLAALRKPVGHVDGLIHLARFNDGAFVRFTTEDRQSDTLHSLLFKSKDAVIYSREAFNGGNPAPADVMKSFDNQDIQMASGETLIALGQARGLVERERSEGWPSILPLTKLNTVLVNPKDNTARVIRAGLAGHPAIEVHTPNNQPEL